MAEVLVDYDIEITGPDGRTYGVQSCGRERDDGLWEGWIEFTPVGGGDALRTGRETTQPRRDHLVYWALGLTGTYLDGALLRTLRQLPLLRPRSSPNARPHFEGPAEHQPSIPGVSHSPIAVLDPFRVYASGADVLSGQLNALSRDQLANIAAAYWLCNENPAVLGRDVLIELIMDAVEARSAR